MSDLGAIAALYQQVDNYLEGLRDRYDAASETEDRDSVARQQRLNEQAYFVLAWGQFEARISDACRDAIRRGHQEWRYRRADDVDILDYHGWQGGGCMFNQYAGATERRV